MKKVVGKTLYSISPVQCDGRPAVGRLGLPVKYVFSAPNHCPPCSSVGGKRLTLASDQMEAVRTAASCPIADGRICSRLC